MEPLPVNDPLKEQEARLIAPGLQSIAQWAPFSLERGDGSYLFDTQGTRYTDLFSGVGVAILGHSHPRYCQRVADQLGRVTVGSFTTSARVEALARLAEFVPTQLDSIQLYTSGAEAVEAALRLARAATKRHEVLSFWGGFHGKTEGALAGTFSLARRGWGPLPGGHWSAPYAHCFRCAFEREFPTCELFCARFAQSAADAQTIDGLAAILVEPIQGTAGNISPAPGFLRELRRLADRTGALLIMDEMIAGPARTGRRWGHEHDEIVPDVIVAGKGLANGLPVSAIITRAELAAHEPFARPSGSSSSFGGNPLCAAGIAATLEIIAQDGLVNRAEELGALAIERMAQWKGSVSIVGEVHGKGLMLGIELIRPSATREPLPGIWCRRIFDAALEAGVLLMISGSNIRLYPALNIPTEMLLDALDRVGCVLSDVGAQFEAA
jgi:4-aminobutyrate aminotransferase/4-aminobutyrate aminotransferase/(S)-3-amino-2-methylpropionate transaminase